MPRDHVGGLRAGSRAFTDQIHFSEAMDLDLAEQ
jgi:hypothetical protein